VKQPKTDKPAKEPKPRKVRGAKPPSTTVAGSNALDPDKRALFLRDKSDYAKAMEKLGKAQSAVRLLGKTIKSDGFTLRQIKLAIQLDSPEGEAEFKSLIANDLLAAQYAGAPIGSQLQLFLEPDRTPATDTAYSEGQKASMENRAADPLYDPSTEQHRSFMAGFHDHQAKLAKGINPMDEPKPSRAETLATARAKNDISSKEMN
jgi:hypothetical protein